MFPLKPYCLLSSVVDSKTTNGIPWHILACDSAYRAGHGFFAATVSLTCRALRQVIGLIVLFSLY